MAHRWWTHRGCRQGQLGVLVGGVGGPGGRLLACRIRVGHEGVAPQHPETVYRQADHPTHFSKCRLTEMPSSALAAAPRPSAEMDRIMYWLNTAAEGEEWGGASVLRAWA